MPDKPKVVTLCGSSRFCDIMAVCAWFIERDEKAIIIGVHLLPAWCGLGPTTDCLAEHEGAAEKFGDGYLRMIDLDLSDELFVVNFTGYIGESTGREIAYAQSHGKKIRYYESDEIGDKVNKLVSGFEER